MDQKIIKAGNSLAVTIPSHFVKSAGLKPGQKVKVITKPQSTSITYTFQNTHQLPLTLALKS